MTILRPLLPLLIIVGAALVTILLEAFLRRSNKNYLGYLSLIALIICGIFNSRLWNQNLSTLHGYLIFDNLAVAFQFIFLIVTALVILISLKYIEFQEMNFGEYYGLLLFALSGMLIMVSSYDLIVIFLGLEVLSTASYALAGLKIRDQKSSEAAAKYFLLGSFASALLVLGLAFLFGFARTTQIPVIIQQFKGESTSLILGLMGLGLLLVGFGFKIALVPFHMWTPDVYEGSPTPVTAFFSIGPKAVGFAVLIRLFHLFWPTVINRTTVFWSLWVLAVATMVVANLVALRQSNIKRLLAYSSIAHAGYLLVAILAQDYSSLLFYLAVYLFMNIGAFAAVIALSREKHEYLHLEDFKGIGFQYPWIGAMMTIFLVSLAGFPPTGGFLAKFYVFSSAVQQGLTSLVIIAVMASLISVYYYLRVVVYMYMREPTSSVIIRTDNPALYLVLFLCLYGVLQLGLFPGNILIWIKQAVASLPTVLSVLP
jgi:NADH-quinone oxidoreductase subunit N